MFIFKLKDSLIDDEKKIMKSFYHHNLRPKDGDQKHSEISDIKITVSNCSDETRCFAFKFSGNSENNILSYELLGKKRGSNISAEINKVIIFL